MQLADLTHTGQEYQYTAGLLTQHSQHRPQHILCKSPALARKLNAAGRMAPALYGVNIDGHLGVIYGPHGMACGWEMAQCPYCCGIVSQDALALGVNILSYAILQ